MAYGLPRKNTVKGILRGSCYSVREPWDLALLTKTWYLNIVNSRLPFLVELAYGNSLPLSKCDTQEGLLPSEECKCLGVLENLSEVCNPVHIIRETRLPVSVAPHLGGSTGWPQTQSNPPASASQVLGLQACATLPGCM
ncbi:uncharacterized protein C4orf36 homolog isoform X1 [Cavia porcellus]|uniref:uncharacterized protein C4orf36 homolog isoform X1 n=1 Tax=Cavia porcellus TaxID=10141 RepID=UPI000661C91C